MNPKVFREYDVRGVVGKDLDEAFVYELGQAIGTYAAEHGVREMTLGRDCRLSSETFAACIKRGLLTTGIRVIDIGLCATPMLYFSIRHLQTGGGIMVTGSHNPPEFNGFKICIGPDTIYGEDIQKLKNIIENRSFISGNGTEKALNVTQAYHDFIMNNVSITSGIHLVLDAGNGVGGFFSLPLFEKFGCKVTPLYCEVDGSFPNHFADPTVPKNLTDIIAAVKREKADIGIAFDGDADRIGVIMNNGEILWGDELLLLFSRFILKDNPGAAIIGEVKCSHRLYNDIERHGGRGIMWKAGHSLIKGKMKETDALMAGEMSGHIFFADRYFGYDDAIYAAMRLLEILSRTGQKLTDILSDVPKSVNTPEIRVECADSIKFQVVDALKEYFRKDYDIIDIDGVRIPFSDGWGLIRSSNTEPVLVLRFEASTQNRLNEIRSIIEQGMDIVMQQFEKVA